jgi:hypothetical protein
MRGVRVKVGFFGFACGRGLLVFLIFLLVCWRCYFGGCFAVLAFPCILIGLLALPLCGAALTFLCRRKEK